MDIAKAHLLWIAAAAVLGLLASVGLGFWIVIRLPPRYLVQDEPWPSWVGSPIWARVAARIAKNVAGGVLVVIGVILAIPGVPGPGLLTILIGIVMLDFPGKRRVERKLLGRPLVLRGVNRLRARASRPPLLPPSETRETPPREP